MQTKAGWRAPLPRPGRVDCNVVGIVQGSSERCISAVVREGMANGPCPMCTGAFLIPRECWKWRSSAWVMWARASSSRCAVNVPDARQWSGYASGGHGGLQEDVGGSRWHRSRPLARNPHQQRTVTDIQVLWIPCGCDVPAPCLCGLHDLPGLGGPVPRAFRWRMHVVTPTKKANSSELTFYKELRSRARKHQRRFLYETNVGAACRSSTPQEPVHTETRSCASRASSRARCLTSWVS